MNTLSSIQGLGAGRSADAARAEPATEPGPAACDISIAVPAYGVVATFSPRSLQALEELVGDVADGAGEAIEAVGAQASAVIDSVAAGAEALADGLAVSSAKVGEAAESLLGYGVLAALVGGRVLDELA